MRIAAQRAPDGTRGLVEVGADDGSLELPFVPRAVIAPGPRLEGAPEWQARHSEFHVKPASVVAPARSAVARGPAWVDYRVQAGLVFRPTPRATPASQILERLIGCHLVTELIDLDSFRIDWEGPRWHIRYGEGMSFDGACPMSAVLATPDEFGPEGIPVEHANGTTLLAWNALADFAALVNRYMELGPELMVLAGWPLGPVLRLADGAPQLYSDRPPESALAQAAWASNEVLGRVESRFELLA